MKLICVTNRKLCQESFLSRIGKLAKAHPYAIMLREKDLNSLAYEKLARKVKVICEQHGVLLILQDGLAAAKMKHNTIHLSMPLLRKYQNSDKSLSIGASIHSVAEAEEAQALGAAYLIAGHIYSTDCKKGVPPRGLPFLRQVCEIAKIPVFAIGGINSDRTREVLNSSASGCCIMSEAMTCDNPDSLVQKFDRQSLNSTPIIK